MRKVFSVALMAAMLSMVAMTKDAGATVTVALEWGACNLACAGLGTSAVTVSGAGGQTLRMDIFLTHDVPGGMTAYGFSLNFDTDLLNELNLGTMGAVEWGGTDTDPTGGFLINWSPGTVGVIPATPESSAGVSGRVNFIESGGLSFGLPATGATYSVGTTSATAPTRYRVAQVFFGVNSAATDGADVFSGDFNNPFDAWLDSSGLIDITGTVLFGTASVNVIPEPGTASLLGLGLVGLVLAGRRSRRS